MKSYELQKTIAQHLKDGLSAQEVFAKIKESPEVNEVACFLYQAQLYKTLILYSIEKLKNNKPAPHPFILKVLSEQKISIPKEAMEILESHLKTQETHPATLTKSILGSEAETSAEEHDLINKLDFVKRQGFLNEEEKIIKELLSIQPDKAQYKEYALDLKERQAHQILKKSKSRHTAKKNDIPVFYAEKSKFKDNLSKKAQQVAKKHPQSSKNLSVFLYFMNWPDEAISLLEKHPNQKSDTYFLLDWLIETGQYVLGLNRINKILENQDIESDILFLMSYKKAQILYYLGQKEQAKKYLNDIVKIKPNYRSAQSLLNHWEENENDL